MVGRINIYDGVEIHATLDDPEIIGEIEYSATTTGAGTVTMFGGGFGIYSPAVSDIGKTIEVEVSARVEGDADFEVFCTFDIIILNSPPKLKCPSFLRFVPLGESRVIQIMATDDEVNYGIGSLHYSLGSASVDFASITDDGELTLSPIRGSKTCEAQVELVVTDDFGAADTCYSSLAVLNRKPTIICPEHTPTSGLWGDTLTYKVLSFDPDSAYQSVSYSILDYTGPGSPEIDSDGNLTWVTEKSTEFIGETRICIVVTDESKPCETFNENNADTCCAYFTVQSDFSLSIGVLDNVLQGGPVELPIFLDSSYQSSPFGSLEFLIDWNHNALTLAGVSAGDFLENNGWEYFTFRFGNQCGSGCPDLSVRIIAIGDMNNGAVHPTGYTNVSAGSNEIARLHFQVFEGRNLQCAFIPVSWRWDDCGDNALTSVYGDTVFISSNVFEIDSSAAEKQGTKEKEFEYIEITDSQREFPTLTGAPDSCSNAFISLATLKRISFYGGGIQIVCPDEIDARGDLNLNGVSNEIADLVILCDFLVNGRDAFSISPEGQIAASETNNDGFPGTVADLVYMIHIVFGDEIPREDLTPFADTVKITSLDGIISTNKELGAILLVFEGDVTPTLMATNMTMRIGKPNGTTRVLLKDINGIETIKPGSILAVTGKLLSVDVSDTIGNSMVLEKGFAPSPGTIPTTFVLNQNYPNPFNPTTTIPIDFPRRSDYTITIYNIRGQKVNQQKGAHNTGTLNYIWAPKGLPSGIYLYKFQAGIFVATKKLVLLK